MHDRQDDIYTDFYRYNCIESMSWHYRENVGLDLLSSWHAVSYNYGLLLLYAALDSHGAEADDHRQWDHVFDSAGGNNSNCCFGSCR